jgi:hypothetical protein
VALGAADRAGDRGPVEEVGAVSERRYTTQDGRTMVRDICYSCWGRYGKDCETCKGEGYVWVEESKGADDE